MCAADTDLPTVLYVGGSDRAPGALDDVASGEPVSVDRVADGSTALERLEQDGYAGVISEYQLPDCDGLELLRRIRADRPHLPFVLYTDAGDDRLASDALDAGADGYVPASKGLDAAVSQLIDAIAAERRAETESEHRYRWLVEASPVPINVFDATGEILYSNDALADLLDVEEPADLRGRSIFEFVDPADRASARAELDQVIGGDEPTGPTQMHVTTADGRRRAIQVSTAPGVYDGEPVAQAVITDVTYLQRIEHELRGERQFIADALDTIEDVFFVTDTDGDLRRWNDALLDVSGYSPEEIAAMEFPELLVPEDVPRVARSFEQLLEEGESVVEVRLLTKDGAVVPIESRSRLLRSEDGDVLGVAGIGRDISERKARMEALESQREQLARLNRTNAIIRDVNAALVTATSRPEIERLVCDRLAGTGPYRLAWIGAYDRQREEIVPSVWAGHERGYLDTLTVPVARAADDERPGPKAIETGAVCTSHVSDPVFDRNREAAEARGYASVTAVPIRYGGATYGLLALYAPADDDFEGLADDVLAELGRTTGAALNAVERKRALIGEPVVELELRIEDRTEFFTRLAAAFDERIGLESVSHLDGLGYAVAVVVETDDVAHVTDVCEQFRSIDDYAVVHHGSGTCRVELELVEVNVVDLLASHGSTLVSLTGDPEGCTVVAELSRELSVRSFVETLEHAYDAVTLLTKRDHPERQYRASGLDLEALLTDRQQEVLEMAFRSGYFTEPRETTGTALAEQLGISSPTFHHHLRSAQRRLLTELYTANAPDD